jgi:hypothetical protein
MARPLTKGSPIQIRLPLSVDAEVRQLAADFGVTPSTLLVESIGRIYGQPRGVGGEWR